MLSKQTLKNHRGKIKALITVLAILFLTFYVLPRMCIEDRRFSKEASQVGDEIRIILARHGYCDGIAEKCAGKGIYGLGYWPEGFELSIYEIYDQELLQEIKLVAVKKMIEAPEISRVIINTYGPPRYRKGETVQGKAANLLGRDVYKKCHHFFYNSECWF